MLSVPSRNLRRWRKATCLLPASLQSSGPQEYWGQVLPTSVSGVLDGATGEEGSIGVGGRPLTGLCPGRVVVTLNPQSSGIHWETASEKGRDLELSTESPCELRQPEPSPFSSKRTMYETEEVRLPDSPLWVPLVGHC